MVSDDFREQQALLAQKQGNEAAFMGPVDRFGSSTIILLTSPWETIHDFELWLRGIVELDDGTVKPNRRAPVNKDTADAIITTLRSLMNPINFLGKTDAFEKEVIVKSNIRNWAELIYIRWKQAGMSENLDQRNYDQKIIENNLTNFAMIAMNRSLDEGDRKWIRSSAHEVTFNQPAGAEKKAGLVSQIGKLFGGGK